MACSWQILNKKVALALLALSIYGLLLVLVSTDHMNPRFLISSLKNRYLTMPWADRNTSNMTNMSNSSHSPNSSNSFISPTSRTITMRPFIYDPLQNASLKTTKVDNVTVRQNTTLTSIITTLAPTTVKDLLLDKHGNDTNNTTQNPLIVLFTTFRNSPEKTHIYQNTIRNWQLLKPWVQPILYTISGELDMSKYALEHGWAVLSVPRTSKQGVPILRHMFLHAQDHYNATYYGYANGDILFTRGLVNTLEAVKPSLPNMKQLLIVGRRTNFQLKPKQSISTLEEVAKFGKKGKLFSTNAQDYFISTRNGYPWKTIPDFVVGRVGYDNWLVVTALVKRMFTIDTTLTLLALHQTGSDGNFAGHSKKPKGDTYINYGLAGSKFDYSLGHVSCGQFFTKLENGQTKILQRTRNGCERTFRRYHVSPYLSLKKQRRRLLL